MILQQQTVDAIETVTVDVDVTATDSDFLTETEAAAALSGSSFFWHSAEITTDVDLAATTAVGLLFFSCSSADAEIITAADKKRKEAGLSRLPYFFSFFLISFFQFDVSSHGFPSFFLFSHSRSIS